MSTVDSPRLSVRPLAPADEERWTRFVAASGNATLFHELAFLAYHPSDRFRFHHLIVEQGADIVAVVPGGLNSADHADRPIFTSPLGASVGGPAFAPGVRAVQVLATIDALQEAAAHERWGGIELTLPPAVYSPGLGDSLSFALSCRGFQLTHRWLCPMLPISAGGGDGRYDELFRDRVPKFVRAARRRGIEVRSHGLDGLADFLGVFADTYRRHGVTPTHTPAEIEDLLTRLPDRVHVLLARQHGATVSGLLVFLLNPHVAYTFYICSSAAHPDAQGNIVAIAALLDWLGERGFTWLDLGPGASTERFNAGVMFFKEQLGAAGHTRDRWRWTPPT